MNYRGGCLVRRADCVDIDALRLLVSQRRSHLRLKDFMLDEDRLRRAIERWMSDPRKQILVAIDNNQVIGFLACELGSHALAKSVPLLKLRYLFTAPGAPRAAVVDLVRRTIEESREMGADLMVSFFGADRPAALSRLATSIGLTLAGTQCIKFSHSVVDMPRWSVQIRHGTEADLDNIFVLAKLFYDESNRSRMLSIELAALRGLIRDLLLDPREVVLVAHLGDELCGFISGNAKRVRGTSLRILKNSYWYVSPHARGSRVAQALLDAFELHGRTQNVQATVISTSAQIHTERTRRFLQRLGYDYLGDTFIACASQT